ncbi:MAG: hypothetical protein R2788_02665 [Saprospiraceae bacterium]
MAQINSAALAGGQALSKADEIWPRAILQNRQRPKTYPLDGSNDDNAVLVYPYSLSQCAADHRSQPLPVSGLANEYRISETLKEYLLITTLT